MTTGLTEALRIAVNISTPLGLLGFVTALIAFYFYRRLNAQEHRKNNEDRESGIKKLKFLVLTFSIVFVLCFLIASSSFVLTEILSPKPLPAPARPAGFPCQVFQRYSTAPAEYTCKADTTIFCGKDSFNLSELVEISCQDHTVTITAGQRPQIRCPRRELKGWIDPGDEALCGDIRSIKFHPTQHISQ